MKLLVVSNHLPRPQWGASARNYHLLKALAREHIVSLLTFADSVQPAAPEDLALLRKYTHTLTLVHRQSVQAKRQQQLLSVLRGRSYLMNLLIVPEMQKTFEILLTSEHFDGVLFEGILIAGYRAPEGIKIIIDQHNLEYEVLQRTYEQEKPSLRKWYSGQESRLVKRGELERCRGANLVVVTSERERHLLQQELPQQTIAIVSNGVDIEGFTRDEAAPETPHKVIFTGTMDYYPNTQAALFFAQQCWPLIRAQIPDATWQIVGRTPPPEVQRLAQLPGVTVTGWVADMRPHLSGAAVAIAPLQIGGGTRLKILEALAMQRAVVSTSIGCEGLAVEPGKHLLVADQPAAFAEAVITLLQRAELRKTLGEAGRALVETTYGWDRCGADLLQAVETLFKTGVKVCS